LRLSVTAAEISCGEGLLRQALANLLENAVKYRRPEIPPEVEVNGQTAGRGYDLTVSDNGLGMSEEDAARASTRSTDRARRGTCQGPGSACRSSSGWPRRAVVPSPFVRGAARGPRSPWVSRWPAHGRLA